MKKVALDLSALRVESFDTSGMQAPSGTVRAHSAPEPTTPDYFTCGAGYTDPCGGGETCRDTCGGAYCTLWCASAGCSTDCNPETFTCQTAFGC